MLWNKIHHHRVWHLSNNLSCNLIIKYLQSSIKYSLGQYFLYNIDYSSENDKHWYERMLFQVREYYIHKILVRVSKIKIYIKTWQKCMTKSNIQIRKKNAHKTHCRPYYLVRQGKPIKISDFSPRKSDLRFYLKIISN